jgi:hypothetical protein
MKHWNWRPSDNVNFGDELGVFILRKLGYEIEQVENIEDADVVSVGSILDDRLPKKRMTVIGTGIGGGPRIENFGLHNVLAVRGEVTRKRYNMPKDTPLGDIAILLPLVYTPRKIDGIGVLYAPHMDTFYDDLVVTPPLTDHTLDTRSPDIRTTIDIIASADFVIATSLHAYIVAKVYGVPVMAAPYPNQKMSKWLDKWVDFESILFDKTLEQRQQELLKVIKERL